MVPQESAGAWTVGALKCRARYRRHQTDQTVRISVSHTQIHSIAKNFNFDAKALMCRECRSLWLPHVEASFLFFKNFIYLFFFSLKQTSLCGILIFHAIFFCDSSTAWIEVVRGTPSSTWPGFDLITSRTLQYISCHWDACSNHSAISDCALQVEGIIATP